MPKDFAMKFLVCFFVFVGLPTVFSAVLSHKPAGGGGQSGKLLSNENVIAVPAALDEGKSIFTPSSRSRDFIPNLQSLSKRKASSPIPSAANLVTTTTQKADRQQHRLQNVHLDAAAESMRAKVSSSSPPRLTESLHGRRTIHSRAQGDLIREILSEMGDIDTLRRQLLAGEGKASDKQRKIARHNGGRVRHHLTSENNERRIRLSRHDQARVPPSSLAQAETTKKTSKVVRNEDSQPVVKPRKLPRFGRRRRFAGEKCIPEEHRNNAQEYLNTCSPDDLMSVLKCVYGIKIRMECRDCVNGQSNTHQQSFGDKMPDDALAKDLMILG